MSDFDYQQLDDIIHSRIRLAIISVLVSISEADFGFIKKTINATDGNLSVNLKKLEEAGYITAKKEFVNRKPLSTYRITKKGHQAFDKYVERLETMIKH